MVMKKRSVKSPSKNPPTKKHEFEVRPYYDDYQVWHWRSLFPGRPRTSSVVFRSGSEASAEAAAEALRTLASKSSQSLSAPHEDRFLAAPHDARRGGWKVLDRDGYRILAEGLSKSEAEELSGALWNVISGIARFNSDVRSNPSWGDVRAAASRAGGTVSRAYERAKPHAKRAAASAKSAAERGYAYAKPRVKAGTRRVLSGISALSARGAKALENPSKARAPKRTTKKAVRAPARKRR